MLLSLDESLESEFWHPCNYAKMFLEHLHSSDEEHADANQLKVLKYMNISGTLKATEVCDYIICTGLDDML